ncbi:probable serine carboxypeptidase CPVL [Pagrus major]|uniref:probable serine carboxypeptidase CPVL n=1 Tax=Pagrus major TaxID=143350 RepID=UPI003CC8CECB
MRGRLWRETLALLLLWACLDSAHSRSCSSFFCRKSHRVSGLNGVDPGSPLFLTPYLEKGAIDEARKLSLVGELPGANVKSYAGYLTVNKKYNSNLFFWFFPALMPSRAKAPVMLWLQGGPGGTSMFGLFVEHGPYVVYKNLTVGMRDYAWTSRYSVLYIDNPVGTGFSFTDDDRGFAQNQDDVGRDLYSALTQFFQIFPEYQSNDFYATGEEPEDQEYFSQFVTLPSVRRAIHVGNLTFHDGSQVEKHLLQDVMKSIKPWLGVLMDHYRVLIYSGQLDVIVAAPLTERFLPTVNWTGADEYKKAPRFHWKLQPGDTEVAGYVRQVGDFCQVIIRGGGHILPYDQPARSFDMIDRFLSTRGWI